MKRFLFWFLTPLCTFGLILAFFVADVQVRHLGDIHPTIDAATASPVAIVFGAAVKRNGDPSDALRDRLLVGLALYDRKLVKQILITGDDGRYHVDEIRTMRTFLKDRGVPAHDILEDGEGYRTYESCKRAVDTFKIKDAILVTQRFHLGRALYLCSKLGMDARGLASDLSSYQRITFFTARDLAASIEAWWDVNVRPPRKPV